MSQEKYIGMDVHPSNDLRCRHGREGQTDHGMHSGDEGGHDS